MASIWRVTATWQNFIGAPGYTKMSFLDLVGQAGATAATGAVRTFFNALANGLPGGATVQVSPEVQEFDVQLGTLIGEISAAATPAIVTGAGTNAYAGGSGMFVGWKTGTIWQGRRVQGRTFLVPFTGVFETNGTITGASITLVQSAADALIADAGSTFAIWAKKMTKPTDPTVPPDQIDGAAFQVLSASVKDQASQLRSRRT